MVDVIRTLVLDYTIAAMMIVTKVTILDLIFMDVPHQQKQQKLISEMIKFLGIL